MHDFTEKELLLMSWALHYVRERTNNRGNALLSLQKKIAFQIVEYESESREACPEGKRFHDE